MYFFRAPMRGSRDTLSVSCPSRGTGSVAGKHQIIFLLLPSSHGDREALGEVNCANTHEIVFRGVLITSHSYRGEMNSLYSQGVRQTSSIQADLEKLQAGDSSVSLLGRSGFSFVHSRSLTCEYDRPSGCVTRSIS